MLSLPLSPFIYNAQYLYQFSENQRQDNQDTYHVDFTDLIEAAIIQLNVNHQQEVSHF